MKAERRDGKRVLFEQGHAALIVAIDGSWRRPCTLMDASPLGANLTLEGTVTNRPLKEFFLLLSSTGLAYRRCEVAWVNGPNIGVNFVTVTRRSSRNWRNIRRSAS
jgi:hypothetical protein